MNPKQTPNSPQQPIPDASAVREYWVEKTHELPEIRMDKVRATREALEKNAYENEQMLDDTVTRMSEDLPLLLDPEDEGSSNSI